MSSKKAIDSNYEGGANLEFVDLRMLEDESASARLRYYRKRLGLTQVELAGQCGLSQSTISRAESDLMQLPLPILNKICHALDVTLHNLTDSELATFTIDELSTLTIKEMCDMGVRSVQVGHGSTPSSSQQQ
jgi:DNA-binding XRE family transcriptional regulator